MPDASRPDGDARFAAVAFTVGFATATVIAAACLAFVGHRIGFRALWDGAGLSRHHPALAMPDELVDELAAMDGVVDNAGNPTNVRRHDTIMVRPDDELEKALRPDVSVDGYQLRAADAYNLDPPVVYVRSGAPLSDALRSYLAANTRVRYTYRTDADGFRRTVPEVAAARHLLVVGDSAAFGVGVEDADTVASRLQQLFGSSIRVVNAGVPGYDGDQAFLTAKRLSGRSDYDALVYVAHNNDFSAPDKTFSSERAGAVLDRFATLRDRFPDGVVVALFVSLRYTAEDVLGSQGWSREQVESITRLRRSMAAEARAAGLGFVDWGDVAEAIRERERTIFAPWPLYVDRSHLSPRGLRLLAEEIYGVLARAIRED
jgi:lysophospholipase L1-like esterase